MSTTLRIASFFVAAALLAACGRDDAVEKKLVGSWQTAVAAPTGAYELHFTAQANGLYRTDLPGAAPGSPEIGIFKATGGHWRLERAAGGVDEGTYEFVSDDSVLFKSKTGVVLWTRVGNGAGTAATQAAPSQTSAPVVPASGVGETSASLPAGGGAPSTALLETGPFGPATEGSATAIPASGGFAPGAPNAASGASATGGASSAFVPNAAGAPSAAFGSSATGMPTAAGFAAPVQSPAHSSQATLQSAPGQPGGAAQPPPTMTTKQAVANIKGTVQQTASQTVSTAKAGAQQVTSQAASSATDAVNGAAAETNKKVGQKIGAFASNAGSKIKNFFTGGKAHTDDSGSADPSAQKNGH